MSIDKNQVKKVAKLSRISLDDKNLDSLSNDLASILKFVEQLNKLLSQVYENKIYNASTDGKTTLGYIYDLKY